jgi:hypothetical protein
MVRFLDGLCLLKEVDTIEGARYSSTELKQMYPDRVVVIRHASYIYTECLCDVARDGVTRLDEYIHVGEIADRMSMKKEHIQARIRCMKKNPQRSMFEFLEVCNMYFIKLDKEFRYLFENFQPFSVKLKELDDPNIQVKLLGDIKIGFY